jgi:hypothetical protein
MSTGCEFGEVAMASFGVSMNSLPKIDAASSISSNRFRAAADRAVMWFGRTGACADTVNDYVALYQVGMELLSIDVWAQLSSDPFDAVVDVVVEDFVATAAHPAAIDFPTIPGLALLPDVKLRKRWLAFYFPLAVHRDEPFKDECRRLGWKHAERVPEVRILQPQWRGERAPRTKHLGIVEAVARSLVRVAQDPGARAGEPRMYDVPTTRGTKCVALRARSPGDFVLDLGEYFGLRVADL